MATIQENMAAKKAKESGSTPGVEIILGSGAVKLAAAALAIKQATEGANAILDQLGNQASTLGLQIANGEERLTQLEAEQKEKIRSNKVEVDLTFKADQAAAATEYANKNGKLLIDSTVYYAEKDAQTELASKFEERVTKEVAEATKTSAIKHSYEIKGLESDYKEKNATNLANISSLEQQLTAVRAENARLYKQIDDERAASIERAKASAVGSINLGSGQGR